MIYEKTIVEGIKDDYSIIERRPRRAWFGKTGDHLDCAAMTIRGHIENHEDKCAAVRFIGYARRELR